MASYQLRRIESEGKTTPEYNTLRHVSVKINRALKAVKKEITCALHAACVIPNREVADDIAGVILSEVERDPIIFYAFQNVLEENNDHGRYKDVLTKLDMTFYSEYKIIHCLLIMIFSCYQY